MDLPVWEDQTINTEIFVAKSAGWSKVSAIRPILFAIFGFLENPLIHPIPDKSSLEWLVQIKKIPVILQVTNTVSHSMSIFAEDEGTIQTPSQVFLKVMDRAVHRTDDIRMRLYISLFVLDRPRGIALFDPCVSGLKIHAIARFVAE